MPDGVAIALVDQLGTVLRSARKARGVTQVDLADRLGLVQSRVSFLENHPDRISALLLVKWCNALDLKLMVAKRTDSDLDQPW